MGFAGSDKVRGLRNIGKSWRIIIDIDQLTRNGASRIFGVDLLQGRIKLDPGITDNPGLNIVCFHDPGRIIVPLLVDPEDLLDLGCNNSSSRNRDKPHLADLDRIVINPGRPSDCPSIFRHSRMVSTDHNSDRAGGCDGNRVSNENISR